MNENKKITHFYDKRYFEVLTEEYSHISYHYVFNILYSILKKYTGKKDSVLDLGCGVGWLLKKAKDIGCNVYGIDFAKSAIKIAKAEIGEANLLTSDAAHIPFRNETFNLVASIWLLEHVENPEKILAEIARTLKIGGLAIVMSPSGELRYTKKKSPDVTSFKEFGKEHFWEFSPLGMQTLLQESGFLIRERRGIYRFHGLNIFTFPIFKLMSSIAPPQNSSARIPTLINGDKKESLEKFTRVFERLFPSSVVEILLNWSFNFFLKIEGFWGNKPPFNSFGIETLLIGQKLN